MRALASRVWATLAGAGCFSCIVLARLWTVDEYWWVARDDAVITFSHARNAADFGSIGVSPGGDRVEGFSSPLQFALATGVELVSSPGYRTMSLLLTTLALVLTGVFLAIGSRWLGASLGVRGRSLDLLTVGFPTFTALILASSWTATGWVGSGMENPWLLAAGVSVVALGVAGPSTRAARIVTGVALFALSIGRVEFAAFTGPLVVAVAAKAALAVPAGVRRRAFAEVAAVPVAGTAAVHLARRWYFGEWLPNTAVVQARSTGVDQMIGLAAIVVVGVAIAAETFARATDGLDVVQRRIAISASRSATIVGLAATVWWSASGRAAAPVNDLVLFGPLFVLLIAIGVALQLCRAVGLGAWPSNAVFATLLLVPLGQYVVMGPARLDGYRVLSIAVPFAAIWLLALLVRVVAHVGVGFSAPVGSARRLVGVAFASVVVGLAGGVVWGASTDTPRYLNYAISGTDRLLDAADSVREGELDSVGLPLLANPDLGKVSFAKRAVMVDLGLLGDPLLTRVVTERDDLVPTFLHDVARPDVVEVHGGFSCAYAAWLSTERFAETYRSTDEAWSADLGEGGCFLDGRSAVWLRIDAADEYTLTRALIAAPDPAELVVAAIADCASRGTEPFRCEGVRRSVQRAAASLRDSGQLPEVAEVFAASPSADLSRALLFRGPGWAADAYDAFLALSATPTTSGS